MSVQAISWVLEHSPSRGTDRLVLIALANHAGASPVDGAWESYPGLDRIGAEAGVDNVRTVQYALKRLEETGQIIRLRNAAPDERFRRDRRPNLYRILTAPPGGTQHPTYTHPVVSPRGPRGASPRTPRSNNRVQPTAPRRTADGVQAPAPRATPEPVENPPSGVQSTNAPPAPRGATRPRHGVNVVAPKPSVNPSVETTPAVPSPPGDPPVDRPPGPNDARDRRLRDLMGRRADRPTATTGLADARSRLRRPAR